MTPCIIIHKRNHILVDSLNFRMSATLPDSFGDSLDINSLLTQIYEGLHHSQSELVQSQVETFLMEKVHCRVVTVMTTKQTLFVKLSDLFR